MRFLRSSRALPAALALVFAMLAGCTSGDLPDALELAPKGAGPKVVFDAMARPLPLIPLPNDLATFADPTSRTGRRLNATLTGMSAIERHAREGFSELEGWGTSAPISVQFARPPGLPDDEAALDLEAFSARHAGYDLRDDAVYVVDLTSGTPALLDVNHGHFPQTVAELGQYWPNDPRKDSQNLLFETVDEAPGRARLAYDPALDSDFDGVLDKPNTFAALTGIAGVDDVLTWYERETDTLIVRPTLPLVEKHEYAVVLTDRLIDGIGQPVSSPFPQVYHPLQRASIERLSAVLSDGRLQRFFGDLAGTGLRHVAFAWSFTTGPQTEDLRLLRDGLAARGPFAWLAGAYPATHELFPVVGKYASTANPPGWDKLAECKDIVGKPYTMRFVDFAKSARTIIQQMFGFSGPELDAVLGALDHVDHLVVGTFTSPQLVGDPAVVNPDAHFQANFQTGEARVAPERVKFWIAIPKETANTKQPFPLALWNHGTGLFAEELLFHAGAMARQGVALAAIDMPGHGLPLDGIDSSLAKALLSDACLAPLVNALTTTRARDLNGDGFRDSGGDLWSAHVFHTRDMLRQAVVDELQFLRVLRSFDGKALAPAPYVQSASSNLAGDFDGNGIVDFAGPSAPQAIAGESFGALVTQVIGALDPLVKVAVPISGAAGLGDVASRSYGVVDPVLGQLLSPLVVTVPAAERASKGTRCTAPQRSLRLVVNDLTESRELEVACLADERAPAGATFVLRNLKNGQTRCARSSDAGLVRMPVAASAGDALAIDFYKERDAVTSYGTCAVKAGATKLATVSTWEVSASVPEDIPGNDVGCTDTDGCQQFHSVLYGVGSALVSPQDGYGLRRQTPEFRRLMNLTQHVMDAVDPVNYAAAYVIHPMNGPDGRAMGRRALLNIATLGDGYVNVGASVQFARAAGLIPFFPGPDAARVPEYLPWAVPSSIKMIWGKSPDEILRDKFVIEGVSRLERTPAGARCSVNYASSAVCTSPPSVSQSVCRATLYDPDYLDEGAAGYDQQHPSFPLRLARDITQEITGDDGLVRAFRPRSVSRPLYTDADGSGGQVPLGAHLGAFVNPTGQHSWIAPNPCKAFDDVQYLENLVARFIATGGTDLPYLSRPGTHGCLARSSCDFLQSP